MTTRMMMMLAVNYLEQVDRLDREFSTTKQLLEYTVKIYRERKEQGLEQ